MSAREMLLNGRALSATLAGVSSGLSAASTRARWPGATQFAEDSSTAITVTNLTGAPTWNSILSLTLDPGRWLLIGATTVERQNIASGNQWRSGFRVLTGGVSAEALAADMTSGSVWRRAPLNAHMPVFSAVEFTVDVDAYHRNGPATGNANAVGTSLIAYPL